MSIAFFVFRALWYSRAFDSPVSANRFQLLNFLRGIDMDRFKRFFHRLGWTLVVSTLLLAATFCVFFFLGLLFRKIVPDYAWICNIVMSGALIFILVWMGMGEEVSHD